MAGMGTSMSVKAMAAVVARAEGLEVNVSAVCREAGVARKTFYKWLDRYRAEGLDGLEERSRRPHNSPNQAPPDIEDAVVRLRKELRDAGLDHGAKTIESHLELDGRFAGRVPVNGTVHRILVRRGLVKPEPRKRPKASWHRFEAPAPNEVWQIDATEWLLASGATATVFNIIDDHSRVAIASRATSEASTAEAWATFCSGAAMWGPPAGMLSDNGLCFSGKLRRFEVTFEANLRDAGVRPFTGRPYHPQTTGKVERFQQTLKKRLRQQPSASDLVELQGQLDEFCRIYNHLRPHQGIGRNTPISRWRASLASQPASEPLPHPDYATRRVESRVSADGKVTAGRFIIQLGAKWQKRSALVLLDGQVATVLIDGEIVRHLTLDHDRTYQPLRPKPAPPLR
jgi:transposase InsO family protein